MKSKKINKKAIGPIIAVSLLIIVVVVGIMFFNVWYESYSSGLFADTEKKEGYIHINLEHLDQSSIYIKNSANSNLSYNNIKIDDKSCEVSGTLMANDVTRVPLGFCTSGVGVGIKEILLITDDNIFSKYMMLSSMMVGNLSIEFSGSSSCPQHYSKIFAMKEYEDGNSHAEIASQTNYIHSICLSHVGYEIGTNCSATKSETLFYLGDVTNSHIWFDTSLAYDNGDPNYYNWQEVCISTHITADLDVVKTQNDMTLGGYNCIASYIEEEINGGVVGGCNAHNDKIWVKIE